MSAQPVGNDISDGTSTQTAFAVVAGVAAVVVALVVFVFYFLRDRNMSREIGEVQRRFDAFKVELQQEQQKKMFKYSKGIVEFLKQYKKPILLSAFDLQSRLTNQVKNNFLYSFLQERGGERDKNYALYNFSFVFAEFLGWLEVIRQELVFVTGDDDTPLLGSLIDGIKFQLTGETPIQGTALPGQGDNPEFEEQSKIFQLYAGELRSIGSVMIITDADGNKSILNADEFQRLMTVKAPAEVAGNEAALIDWARSRERLFQDMMLPLFDHLRHMARLPKGEAPIRRLAIFQVLLCKLIDLIDNAVPWDSGPKYDPMEEGQFIARDFRLTPLVVCLNSHQRNWLAVQPFMENAERQIADERWFDHMEGKDKTWRKVCFCGFREDLAGLAPEDRDKKPGMWPGACPPKLPRVRKVAEVPGKSTNMKTSKSFFASLKSLGTSKNMKGLDADKEGVTLSKRLTTLAPRPNAAAAAANNPDKAVVPLPPIKPPPPAAAAPPPPPAAAKPEEKKAGDGGAKGGAAAGKASSPASSNSDSLATGSTASSSGPAKVGPEAAAVAAAGAFRAITIPEGGARGHPGGGAAAEGGAGAGPSPHAAAHVHFTGAPQPNPFSAVQVQQQPRDEPKQPGSLLAGTGVQPSAVLRPYQLHPMQLAALAHVSSQQQAQQQQPQLQQPQFSAGLPSPFSAVRKWGAGAKAGGNKVLPDRQALRAAAEQAKEEAAPGSSQQQQQPPPPPPP